MNRGLPPIHDEVRRQAELALRERVRQLQRAIDQEHARPAGEQRRQALDLFSAELIDAERDYQAALAAFLTDEPGYAAARALASVSSNDVQGRLAADTALVDYVVADEGVSIFVIRSTGIQAKTIPIRSVDLAAKVEWLRDLIVREPGTDWQAPAASLCQTLVAPIEQAGWLADVHHLYLVPHGILHYVPFAALPRGREFWLFFNEQHWGGKDLKAVQSFLKMTRETAATWVLPPLGPDDPRPFGVVNLAQFHAYVAPEKRVSSGGGCALGDWLMPFKMTLTAVR
jgi:CHAT domain-containing protein